MKKLLIVTHHDLDGWMSALAIKSSVKNFDVKVVWDANPSVEKTMELIGDNEYDVLYVLDRQCPAPNFFEDASKVRFYDHHVGTAIEGIKGIHTTDMAACNIVASDLRIHINMSGNLIEFCEYASLWDTFQWKNATQEDAVKAIKLNKVKLMYDTFEEFEESIGDLTLDEYLSAHKEAIAIADKMEDRYINHKMSTIKKVDFRGIKVGFFTWEKLVSQISDKFLTENDDCDIAIGYNAEYNSISFRSKVTDVASIAKEFGGGGHVKAAGCPAKGELVDFVRQFILN